MKTWLTYLAAAAMGLAFELVLKDTAGFVPFITFMSEIVMKLGVFIVFPLVFVSMMSGTASLTRKSGRTGFTWLSTIFWALFTSAAFACIGVLVFRIFPAAFPMTSTVPESAEQALDLIRFTNALIESGFAFCSLCIVVAESS